MDIVAVESAPDGTDADVLALAVAEPLEPGPELQALDRALGGRIERLIADGELTAKRGKVTTIHVNGEIAARRVAIAGLGTHADAESVRTAAATVSKGRAGTIAWVVDPAGLPVAEQARAVADGLALGRYDAGRWKSDADRPPTLETLTFCGPQAAEAVEPARRAALVADWANRARDLVNAPGNVLTPIRLAEVAREIAERFPLLSVDVLGQKQLERAGMGAILAVSQGSHNPPQLVTLRYEPETPVSEELVLGIVGKGITFDTGGISLKPYLGLEDMKSDMAGGAAAIAALGAIAELELPIRAMAVVPACENMPAGHATRPGDIIRATDGTTIEITNTDAEGRLVLADALLHARDEGATHLLDLATLTGTIQTALGDFYAGVFGNDDAWVERIVAAAKTSGDHAWPLPTHHAYEGYLDSKLADLKNTPESKRGSSIIAALFLKRFAGEGPWAHLDIAGTAYLDRGRDYYPHAGATGYGVRLVVELASSLVPTE